MKNTEDCCSALSTQVNSLIAENNSLRGEKESLRTNLISVAERVSVLEATLEARARTDKERDQTTLRLKDRSNSLRKAIRGLRDRINAAKLGEPDQFDEALAGVVSRLGRLEGAGGTAQGTSSSRRDHTSLELLRHQVAYLARWVSHHCDVLWDIDRYNRRRSLHVVSSFVFFFASPLLWVL